MRNRVACLTLGLLLSGCFTSTEPVWEAGQVFEDARIEGRYANENGDGKKDGSTWFISPSHRARSYDVVVREGSAQIELEGTLFRLGTVAFLDLYPVRDSGMRDSGGAVSVTDVLHHYVYDPRHILWKVEISDTNVTYRFPSKKGVLAAAKRHPS